MRIRGDATRIVPLDLCRAPVETIPMLGGAARDNVTGERDSVGNVADGLVSGKIHTIAKDTHLLLLACEDADPPAVFFSADERQFADRRLRTLSRRREWLWGRYAVKRILSDCHGIVPATASLISANELPRVRIEGSDAWPPGEEIFVSLAHKGGFALAGAAREKRIGVDVEVPPALPRTALIAIGRACSRDDLAQAEKHDSLSRKDYLLLLWCAKESAVKAGLADTVFATQEWRWRIGEEAGGHASFVWHCTATDCANACSAQFQTWRGPGFYASAVTS